MKARGGKRISERWFGAGHPPNAHNVFRRGTSCDSEGKYVEEIQSLIILLPMANDFQPILLFGGSQMGQKKAERWNRHVRKHEICSCDKQFRCHVWLGMLGFPLSRLIRWYETFSQQTQTRLSSLTPGSLRLTALLQQHIGLIIYSKNHSHDPQTKPITSNYTQNFLLDTDDAAGC